MIMTNVSSSNLSAVGYEDGKLQVDFLNGTSYVYSDVPRHIYDGLMPAPSKGSYLDQYVKKAGYHYTRIR